MSRTDLVFDGSISSAEAIYAATGGKGMISGEILWLRADGKVFKVMKGQTVTVNDSSNP